MRRVFRQTLSFLVLLLLLALLWEGAKWFAGDPWRPDNNPFGITHTPPLRWKVTSDLNLPHLWEIGGAFDNPSRRNGPPLWAVLFDAAIFTFREALVGFFCGSLLGLLLGIFFVHSRLLERGCMPYVIASQTVPILAIAPMVIIWLKAGWFSVAVIAAYLTFFPVTINTLRGLRSPDPRALELMHSYAATPWHILWKLRFPAALPYIFTAFKISATASVVGSIIGELPSGIRDGLGGAILNFNQYYISGPERLWAVILVSAVVGIAFYLIVTLVEAVVLRGRRPVADVG
jgi:NitT/TauT family transport system permease protein